MWLTTSRNVRPGGRQAVRCAMCALLAACVLLNGCATAMNGPAQRVAVASDPPGARVYMNGAPVGVTPAFVDVPRRDPDLKLRLEKDGYQPTMLPIERSRSRWVAGNLLFAGVPINDYSVEMWLGAMALYTALGSLLDVRSGGAYKRPGLVRATLDRIQPANDAALQKAPGSFLPQEARRRNRLLPAELLCLTNVTCDVTLDRDQELRRRTDGSGLRWLRRSPLAGADSAARQVEAPGDRCGRSAR